MRIADNWVDYELINMDNGMKKKDGEIMFW